jgi:hypothetical protein
MYQRDGQYGGLRKIQADMEGVVIEKMFATIGCVGLLMLSVAGGAQAMPVSDFYAMTPQDAAAYKFFLFMGSEKVLRDEGHPDLATSVHQLFFEQMRPGDQFPAGEAEFLLNLNNARFFDAERAQQNPSAPRVQVESALLGTLGKHGVPLTPEFVKAITEMANSFKAKSLPGK